MVSKVVVKFRYGVGMGQYASYMHVNKQVVNKSCKMIY